MKRIVPDTNWLDVEGDTHSWWRRPVDDGLHVQMSIGLGAIQSKDAPGLCIVKDDAEVELTLFEARQLIDVLIDAVVDLAAWKVTEGD